MYEVRRSVLISHSEYFKSTFNFDDTQLNVEFDPAIVSPKALALLARFMVKNALEPTMDTVEDLFYAANYLQVEKALQILMDYLHKEMETQNPMTLGKSVLLMYFRLLETIDLVANEIKYQFKLVKFDTFDGQGKALGEVEWSLHCRMFILARFKTIMYEKCILELNEFMLKGFLNHSMMNLCEEDVLRFIKVWIMYDLDQRRSQFGSLVLYVRYDADMKMDFLIDELFCYCQADTCNCLCATDYVLAVVAKRNGMEGVLAKKGPVDSGDKRIEYSKMQIKA